MTIFALIAHVPKAYLLLPPPGSIMRRWAGGDAILIIEIEDPVVTRIGISTWANTVYPHEKVIVYGSDTSSGPWDEICTIITDARVVGIYKMVYSDDFEYGEVAKRVNSNIYQNTNQDDIFNFNILLI